MKEIFNLEPGTLLKHVTQHSSRYYTAYPVNGFTIEECESDDLLIYLGIIEEKAILYYCKRRIMISYGGIYRENNNLFFSFFSVIG